VADVVELACADIVAALPAVAALLDAFNQADEPAEQANATPVPETAEPLDAAALQAALHTLAGQLCEADMAAMTTMEALQRQFGRTLARHLNPMAEAVTALDFGAALQRVQMLLQETHDTPPGAGNAAGNAA
jgi:hypothetical protein